MPHESCKLVMVLRYCYVRIISGDNKASWPYINCWKIIVRASLAYSVHTFVHKVSGIALDFGEKLSSISQIIFFFISHKRDWIYSPRNTSDQTFFCCFWLFFIAHRLHEIVRAIERTAVHKYCFPCSHVYKRATTVYNSCMANEHFRRSRKDEGYPLLRTHNFWDSPISCFLLCVR